MKTLHLILIISSVAVFAIVMSVGIIQSQSSHKQTTYQYEIHEPYNFSEGFRTVTIQNRTFFVDDVTKTLNTANATEMEWFGIKFSFPHGSEMMSTPGGNIFESYVTFQGDPVPYRIALGQSSLPDSPHYDFTTVLSTHTNPQAGFTLHNGTIHLLVNWPRVHSDLIINGLNETYRTGQTVDFEIEVKGFGYFNAGSTPDVQIEKQDGTVVWTNPQFIVLCCPAELTDYDKKFNSSNLGRPLIINQTGSYKLVVSYNGQTVEKEFEITKQLPTYLAQTVDEWKNKTPDQLYVYYEKYKDNFYTELGSFLIKDEMKKELERQKIVNIHDDFEVFPGMTLDSLPPHISYDAVVNATDGNSYLLLGGVFANKLESLKITKLAFDKDVLNFLNSGKKLSYANQFVKAPKVVISEQTGNSPLVEPYSLTLDLDKNNLVTFYNDLTVPIRIQQYGSGLTIDEGGLSWKSKIIGPNETVVIPFNKTGYYEWNARSPPKESENWWEFKGSGQIAAFSPSNDNSTFQEKLKMAGTYVVDSDIPWSSVGTGNDRGLEIGFYTSVYHMIPDAQKYYTARAKQLIPFDVTVVIEVPTFVTDGVH